MRIYILAWLLISICYVVSNQKQKAQKFYQNNNVTSSAQTLNDNKKKLVKNVICNNKWWLDVYEINQTKREIVKRLTYRASRCMVKDPTT